MVRIKFQDGAYLGFIDGKACKVSKEDAWSYSSVLGARTALKYVFASRVLKGYNTPVFVDKQDVAHEKWDK